MAKKKKPKWAKFTPGGITTSIGKKLGYESRDFDKLNTLLDPASAGSWDKFAQDRKRSWEDVTNVTGKKKDKKIKEQAAADKQAVGSQYATLFDPYAQAGLSALQARQSALGLGGQAFDPSIFTNNPQYQFAMQQGLHAGQTALAGTGLVGREAKELTRFASGLASNTFQDYINNLSVGANQGMQALNAQASMGSGIALANIDSIAAAESQVGQASYQGAVDLVQIAAAAYTGGATAAAGAGASAAANR